MKKILLIFGAEGALGKGVSSSLIKKNYDKIYLFDFKKTTSYSDDKIEFRIISDLSIEQNAASAFEGIQPDKNSLFFLFSTIGGFTGGKNLWETSSDEWQKMINMNLIANFNLAKYFSLLVKKSAGGSICFTTAFTGLNAENTKAPYGVSKSALIHLVKTLALEGKEINLSVNSIAPLIIDTTANREWMKDANFENWIKPEEAGNFVNTLFDNFNFVSGNNIILPHRFEIIKK
jgi:NAD(P)-dependent dehydrogenase (short-subunit alcohol dehydrogenase family)